MQSHAFACKHALSTILFSGGSIWLDCPHGAAG